MGGGQAAPPTPDHDDLGYFAMLGIVQVILFYRLGS
jgi:hypothetical protein